LLNLNPHDIEATETDPEYLKFKKEFDESMKQTNGTNSHELLSKFLGDLGGPNSTLNNPNSSSNEQENHEELFAKLMKECGTNNNNTNQNADANSNPFSETFSKMNNNSSSGMDFDLQKILSSLTDLANSSENKTSDDVNPQHVNGLIRGLIEQLIETDLLKDSFSQMKETIIKYLQTHENIDSVKKDKYNIILKNIDTILSEISKPTPNKELIIDTFLVLHDTTDLDDEVFAGMSQNVSSLLMK
jgi:hypothetical protein